MSFLTIFTTVDRWFFLCVNDIYLKYLFYKCPSNLTFDGINKMTDINTHKTKNKPQGLS